MTDEEINFWIRLRDWNLNDIDKCLSSNINYGAAKLMLSYIDILGGFYGGLIQEERKYYVRPGGDGRSKNLKIIEINGVKYTESGSKEQFLSFVKNYINEFYKIKFEKKSAAEYLYDHFRCGLIHEGHPKIGTGITKLNNKELLLFDHPIVPIVLNIQYLRDCLRAATFEYEDDVFVKNIKERVIRWRDRFQYLKKDKLNV